MLTIDKHHQGLRHYRLGQFVEASRLFSEALEEDHASELWNDWAASQLAMGHTADAERGFRRALSCDPENAQAAVNLGAILADCGQLRLVYSRKLCGEGP
jgi:Flp pilus assembly protein TadD